MVSDFAHVASNLQGVLSAISREAAALGRSTPRLVAVSKTFPAEAISEAYKQGQRHFGENYIQELISKSESLKAECPDIKWHYIGNIQTNKIKQLARVHNLAYVESIDSVKHAVTLSSALSGSTNKLNVFLQVNTSNEEGKGGVNPDAAAETAKEIVQSAPNVTLAGLMTIGSLLESRRDDQNADFLRLVDTRKKVAEALQIAENDLELSMGMSSDFLIAIKSGSTNVRVGSSIFGNRVYKN
uniref:Pyridoxal phosphate homeostasis protein n=1 Tax=Panagrellus redivivus TaxID=6233 RepID=A0A7E4V2A5_PANRE